MTNKFLPLGKYVSQRMAENTAPVQPVKQEPVAWAKFTKDCIAVSDKPFEDATPLYAAPVSAKREWVDLTPIELAEAFVDKGNADAGIRAVIAAFKEKNN